jgi:hypothetical protein
MNAEPQHGHSSLGPVGSDDDLPIAALASPYPPPLKSTIASLEDRYEVENARASLESEQEEPLLMQGLMQEGRQRGSVEHPREASVVLGDEGEDDDGERIPLWGSGGGGTWAAVANMANSILGAGMSLSLQDFNTQR